MAKIISNSDHGGFFFPDGLVTLSSDLFFVTKNEVINQAELILKITPAQIRRLLEGGNGQYNGLTLKVQRTRLYIRMHIDSVSCESGTVRVNLVLPLSGEVGKINNFLLALKNKYHLTNVEVVQYNFVLDIKLSDDNRPVADPLQSQPIVIANYITVAEYKKLNE